MSKQARVGRIGRCVNVNFSETEYQMLDKLARKRGTSIAEILRDALALEAWIDQEVAKHKEKSMSGEE